MTGPLELLQERLREMNLIRESGLDQKEQKKLKDLKMEYWVAIRSIQHFQNANDSPGEQARKIRLKRRNNPVK